MFLLIGNIIYEVKYQAINKLFKKDFVFFKYVQYITPATGIMFHDLNSHFSQSVDRKKAMLALKSLPAKRRLKEVR